MNTGSKLALASVALVASATALPAAAAPMFFQGSADMPFMVSGRDSGEFKAEFNKDESSRQDERSARKSEKRSQKKDGRKNEPAREHESDEPGYGYGYERRYPAAPILPNPRFDDRGRR